MNTNPQTKDTNWSTVEVSMVFSAKSTETHSVTVGEALGDIRSGKWAKQVQDITVRYAKALEAAQEEGKADPVAVAKEAVRKEKEKLPGVLFSDKFTRRAGDALVNHSGLLCLDADNCAAPEELRAKIAADDYCRRRSFRRRAAASRCSCV